jgi:glycosyltransferase involved in cell wall biosynthesis
MATIGLDATYTVDPQPSGIAIYCRKLIESLATLDTPHRFLICYRLSRFKRRRHFMRPAVLPGSRGPTFSIRLMQPGLTFWLPWQAEVFHSLAQRPPAFHFKKEIVTVHDLFPVTGRDYSTPEFLRKFGTLLVESALRAVRIITPSQYTAEQLVQHTGVPREKIRVIPEGVDPPARSLTPEERWRERTRLVGQSHEMVLSVGVLQTRKNTINALRALEILPACYRLVLVGGDGYGSEAIHDFIRRQGLGSRVRVLGHVPASELPALYQAASVFLFPSLEEGFGLPVLEAMAHGLPVVASRASSLPEVGGEVPLYVDPHDPHDIAGKVQRAAEDEELRQKMIQQGVARARQFTWRRTAEATLRVYDEVLAL